MAWSLSWPVLLAVVLPVVCGPLSVAGEATGIVGRYEAVWNSPPTGTPSNSSVDGPLMGNGDMLVSVGGPPEAVVFHLGKNDFWRLEQGNGNAAPQPVGTLSLRTIGLSGAGYAVTQSLAEAVTRMTLDRGDGSLRMESRVLAQENMLLVGLTAEQRDFEVICRLAAHGGRDSVAAHGEAGGALWAERAFEADGVDIPTRVACAMTTLGGAVGSGDLRPEASSHGSHKVNIGREQWEGGDRWGFDGGIDELCLYKVALTGADVAELFAGRVPSGGLLRHWPMESLPAGSVNASTGPGAVGSATEYRGGSDSYSDVGTMTVPEDIVSLACWVNIRTTGTANYILSCGEWNDGVSLGLSGGKLRFTTPGGFLETGVLPAGRWVHVAAVAEHGTRRIYVDGALAAGSEAAADQVTLAIAAGETAWVAVAMESLFKSTTPRDDVIARCANLGQTDLPALTAGHAAWWAGYWDRAWIEIGDPVIEKAYYLGYYGMGSCARDSEFPPAIFGWTTTNTPSWNGDYHTNYNFQAPFYALASGNRLEQLAPHDAPVLGFLSRAQGYATDIFGSGSEPWGVIYPVGIGPKGIDVTYNHGSYSYPNKEEGVLTFGQRSNAAYLLLNMAEHWRRTYDRAYGASIYPYAKEVVAFWENYLARDGARYVIVGDAIHEGSGADMNPVLTLGLLRNALDLVLDLSEELGQDADRRAAWTSILGNLSGYTTQMRDGLEVFRYTEEGTPWWRNNTLGVQHIFPGGALNFESDPQLVEYALNTLEVMQRWYDSNGSNSFFPAAVRVGYEPRVILEKLRGYGNRMRPNGFQSGNPHGIENLSTVPGTINEMLCMSHVALGYDGPDGPHAPRSESIIRLFPVWPRERDARFARLRAWGGFLVTSSLWAGEVQFVEVTSEQGRDCTMHNPWPGQTARLYRDGEPAEVVGGASFVFPTTAGETIRLFPGEHALSERGRRIRMSSPFSRGGTPVGGRNLSFEDGVTGWSVSGGTSTFAEDGVSTTTPLPAGSVGRALRADDPGDPVGISQDFGVAETGSYLLSYHVADRRHEHWLNYRVELLAGGQALLDRDSESDPALRPPNGSASHPGCWGRGGTEGDWHHVRLRASVPPSLAGRPLTLRFTSTTRSSGDNGSHFDFVLDHVSLDRSGGSWPLDSRIQGVGGLPDGRTELTVNWRSTAGWTYRVEASPDLQLPWVSVLTDIGATPPVNSLKMVLPPGTPRRFVRVAGW